MTGKELTQEMRAYFDEAGVHCAEGLIENFYLGLKTKAFVMLAGHSSVEKHCLAQLFAQAVGATQENGRYKQLMVRPDWLAPSDLFGRVNLEGKFLPGAILDFIVQAQADREKPYFLCLDGINLSSVEYYLGAVVSGLENRMSQEKRPLLTPKYYGGDEAAAGKYGNVFIPENLYVIGTVNMDEASYPLNQRFLDRVHTMQVLSGDLTMQTAGLHPMKAPMEVPNSSFKPRYLQIVREGEHWEFVLKYFAVFQQINSILTKARAYVEYTLRDDVVLYLLHNLQEDILPENVAMDFAIIQKVLPRVQGSGKMVGEAICQLFRYCAGEYTGCAGAEESTSAKMLSALQKPGIKHPKTARKLAEMIHQIEQDDLAALWV